MIMAVTVAVVVAVVVPVPIVLGSTRGRAERRLRGRPGRGARRLCRAAETGAKSAQGRAQQTSDHRHSSGRFR
jgi:hypothetical protein